MVGFAERPTDLIDQHDQADGPWKQEQPVEQTAESVSEKIQDDGNLRSVRLSSTKEK